MKQEIAKAELRTSKATEGGTMKQNELAKKLGISRSYLSMILSGQRQASPGLAERICSQLPVNSKARLCLGSKHSTAELHPPF